MNDLSTIMGVLILLYMAFKVGQGSRPGASYEVESRPMFPSAKEPGSLYGLDDLLEELEEDER
jgi:hypothetical protein